MKNYKTFSEEYKKISSELSRLKTSLSEIEIEQRKKEKEIDKYVNEFAKELITKCGGLLYFKKPINEYEYIYIHENGHLVLGNLDSMGRKRACALELYNSSMFLDVLKELENYTQDDIDEQRSRNESEKFNM